MSNAVKKKLQRPPSALPGPPNCPGMITIFPMIVRAITCQRALTPLQHQPLQHNYQPISLIHSTRKFRQLPHPFPFYHQSFNLHSNPATGAKHEQEVKIRAKEKKKMGRKQEIKGGLTEPSRVKSLCRLNRLNS